MDWLPASWSQSLNKRVCRFIIHRYLGHLLKEKLDLKQLTVDLYDGVGTIRDLNVDTDFVNSCLADTPVPVKVIDGFIGRIDVIVPWKNLLAESCKLMVDGAEVTLAPSPLNANAPHANSDLMSSMIDSMMASMSSSLDLAKNFLNDESAAAEMEAELLKQQAEDDEADGKTLADEGIEAFAQIIDAVLCRMRIEFTNTVVRIESSGPSKGADNQLNAVEMRIDRLEFLDEQLDSVLKSHDTAEAITTQPHSLSTITDLNKLIHVTGVRLYTDVFERPNESFLNELCGFSASQICTSMYIRRNLNKQKSSSPPSPLECSTTSSSAFQSCYSQLDPNIESKYQSSTSQQQERYCSEPVLFAELAGDRQTIRIKLKNDLTAGNGGAPSLANIDLQMFFGNLFMILTPGQLVVLSSVVKQMFDPPMDATESLGLDGRKMRAKPMMDADFDLVENQLQNDLSAQMKRPNQFAGNWSGEEAFYSVHRRPKTSGDRSSLDASDQQFTSIVVSDPTDMNQAFEEKPQSTGITTRTSHNTEPLEITHCKLKLNNLFLVVALHDPAFYALQPSSVRDWSKQFFTAVRKLPFAGIRSLKDIRPTHDATFDKDHLRFVASPVVLDLNTETVLSSSPEAHGQQVRECLLMLQLSTARAELLECLRGDSVMATMASDGDKNTSEEDDPSFIHIPLVEFGDPLDESAAGTEQLWNEEPCIRMSVNNRKSSHVYSVRCELGACTVELDLSLFDRLYDLLHLGSGSEDVMSMSSASTSTLRNNDMSASLQLRDDLFAGISPGRLANKNSSSESISVVFDVNCPKMNVNFRVPVADLRTLTSVPARPPWWIRRIHPEYFRIQVENARLRIHETPLATLSNTGTVFITGTAVTGWFDGLADDLRLSQPILYALAKNTSTLCALNVKWDTRNKSLKVHQAQQEAASGGQEDPMARSMWSSFIKPATQQHATHAGPFSSRIVMFEDEQRTTVGSREEIRSFRDECLSSSDLNLVIDLPDLRVFLPDHPTYEVIYNRLVNDLALWEPCAPVYRQHERASRANLDASLGDPSNEQYYSIHVPVATNSDQMFAMCKSNLAYAESDSDSETTVDGGSLTRSHATSSSAHRRRDNQSANQRPSNKFCLLLNAGRARAVLGTRATQGGKLLHQNLLAFDGADAEVFVVSGWSQSINVTMVHILAETFKLCQTDHKPSPDPFTDVRTSRFGLITGTNHDRIAPVTDTFAFRSNNAEDHNLAVALKLTKNDDDSKDIVCAVSLCNTEVHVRPLDPTADLWLCQLIDMFDVVDYPIAGYTMPRVITALHVHAHNSQLVYTHSGAAVELAMAAQCRLHLDSVYVCSRIVASSAQLRLRITLEDVRLFLARLPPDYGAKHVNFDETPPSKAKPLGGVKKEFSRAEFVCAAHLGLLHLEVNVAEELLSGAHSEGKKPLKSPLLEVTAKNDVLKLWTCADTLASLIAIGMDVTNANERSAAAAAESEFELDKSGLGPDESGSSAELVHNHNESSGSELSVELQSHLQEMVKSALRDHGYGEEQDASSSRERQPSGQLLEPTSIGSHHNDEVTSDLASTLADAMATSTIEEFSPSKIASGTFVPESSRKYSTGGSDSDESFCVVDEIPGSGITSPSGEPRVRTLLTYEDDHVTINEHHFDMPSQRINLLTSLPDEYKSPPLFRYLLRDVSIVWHIFGGNDFGDNPSTAAYSNQHTYDPLGRVPNVSKGMDTDGGPNRDHTVGLELHLHKLCFVHEMFACDAPAVCRHVLTLADAQIRNRLALSKLNKCLYQYSSDSQPQRTCAPLFCWRVLETVPGEYKIKISALPLRLHMDQDTLEFVHDFFDEIARKLPDDKLTASSPMAVKKQAPEPRIEINTSPGPSAQTDQRPTDSPVQPPPSTPSDDGDTESVPEMHSDTSEVLDTECEVPSNFVVHDLQDQVLSIHEQEALLTQSAITIAGLFDEDIGASITDAMTTSTSSPSATTNNISSSVVRFSKDDQTSSIITSTYSSSSIGSPAKRESPVKTASPPKKSAVVLPSNINQEQIETTRNMLVFDPNAAQTRTEGVDEIYITSFEFSPAVTLRIDYQGASRVNLAQGAVQGLFIGLSQLNCTQLTLKELHYRQGLLGANRCVQYAVSEWLNDIRRNQLPRVVSSVGPLSALAQIGAGIKDLFVMPVKEYQRIDGHIMKGVQKGAHSFGVASASAGIDITQKLVGIVQGMAEFAYDVVSPSYPYHRHQRAITNTHATDLREGLNMAYDTVRHGYSETRDILHYAVADDRASGRSAFRGLLRHATPTVLRPIVLAGRATGHVLDGLKVQLEPETRRELHDKWKVDK